MNRLESIQNNRVRIPFLLLAILMSFSVSYAQTEISIKGLVSDNVGEPIIGASVVIQGTTQGVITDFDGVFNLQAPENAKLLISYVGFETQIVSVNGRKSLKVVLKEDQKVLDEVVVIGYGSVKKKDATGSVTSISIDDKNKPMASSPQELLGGKVAGVSVIGSGGQPGAGSTIKIRGGSSLSASNDPLIVVDGVILSNESIAGFSNGLSSINPNDIETFTVLKDASATAIYGSRASNGVILITTKKGSSGKVKIAYSGTVSTSSARDKYEVLSASEFRDFIGNLNGVSAGMLEALNLYPDASTDWQDEIYRTAVSTEHNLSAYGTVKEFMPYRVSFGYTNQNGILQTSNFERYSGNVSLTPVLFDDHLTINLNAKGSYINNKFADASSVSSAVFFDPTKPVMNGNTNYGGYFTWTTDGTPNGPKTGSAAINPVSKLKMIDDNSTVKTLVGNVRADYKFHFLPDLKINVNASYDYTESDGGKYVSPNAPSGYADLDNSGSQSHYNHKFINKLIEVYGQYTKDLKSIDSHIDIMGGYSYQSYQKEGNTTNYYLSRDEATYGEQTRLESSSIYGPQKYVLLSFFGRVNYSLKDKYLFTATLRDDASSRFAKSNRWGLFPSVALGWKINEEACFKGFQNLSDFKLRLGWGVTGQQDVGGYYPSTMSYKWGQGGTAYPIYDASGNVTWVNVIVPTAANGNLKWEETTTWNAGIDYGFFNGRISGSFDVYKRKTKDLLNTEVQVSAGTNFAELITANVGNLTNNGIEFSINANIIQTKDWNWDFGYNIGYNKSEITALTYNDAMASSAGFRHETTGGDGGLDLKIHSKGYAPGSFYVFEQIYDENGKPIEGAYVDRNGDGVINNDDLRQYKSADPKVIMGFNTSLRYKNWDFGLNGRVSLGNYVYNAIAANNAAMDASQLYTNNNLKNRLRYSTEANFSQRQRLSDYYVQNASFLKIDNITLGYTFNGKIKPRVYASCQNPIIITKYEGLDPEIQNGIDRDMYPRPLTFTVGINLNF